MPLAMGPALAEASFAAEVSELAATPSRRAELIELLRENHPVYDQRGTGATVRMRGWVLLALARHGLPRTGLIFALDELDTGADAYLLAAAARALRSHAVRSPHFAQFVVRALARVRTRDQPVCLDSYGGHTTATPATSAVRELLAALEWLGPHAHGALDELQALRARGAPRGLRAEWDRAFESIGRGEPLDAAPAAECCSAARDFGTVTGHPVDGERPGGFADVLFEDHRGERITAAQVFTGRPTILVFFYTRCDNPLKCSLTVTQLARAQGLLEARGLLDAVNTVAITYDPGFDGPERLRRFAEERGVRLGGGHRALRPVEGIGALRSHFQLGVNFTASVVNRHRIEAYVLDAEGRIAALFERVRWNPEEVVERAAALLDPGRELPPATRVSAAAPLVPLPACPACHCGADG